MIRNLDGGVLMHCVAGKDRTGLVIAPVGAAAVELLPEIGRSRITLVSAPAISEDAASSASLRERGYREALGASRAPHSQGRVPDCPA